MKLAFALLATSAIVAAVPTAASAATLTLDPVKSCYREGETLSLLGAGFTPDGPVDFSRDGESLGELFADPAGTVPGELTLPGLVSGEREFTYAATDLFNPAIAASTTLRVSVTDVSIRPAQGAPNRMLRIRARGFEAGRVLYAHIERLRAGQVRNEEIDLVGGDCGTLKVRQRLFPKDALAGRYRIQFDTYARYQRGRDAQSVYTVKINDPDRPRRPKRPSPSPPPPSPPPVNCQGYVPCLPPGPDVDCAGGSGNGPRYVNGPVSIFGTDPYGLDSDSDGVGCES